MILPILERAKINYGLPTFTLDVNQIALKNPLTWLPQMSKLTHLEWNYFQLSKIELCVTPETTYEILKDRPTANYGSAVYNRFQKSQLFKSRPVGTTLTLSAQESNTLWMGIRNILWPTVNDVHLLPNQRSDVTQVFFHTVTSGSLASSAFITIDKNFHNHASELKSELGISIFTPNDAWEEFQPKFGLCAPNEQEIKTLFNDQQKLLETLRMSASS